MQEILVQEWPIFKEALLIAVSVPLSVFFPMAVVDWTLREKPSEFDPLPGRFYQ